jgi:transposase
MGVTRFATLSDGTFHAPLNSFKQHEMALRRTQQAMSGKTKFSNNWKKAKSRIQRIHARIGNARRVRAAAMCRRTTARRRPSPSVWRVVSRKTPMWSARSMC